MDEKVFVSYCWESDEHKEKVLSFIDFLRDEGGFNANLDQNILQSETATNFNEMMLKNLSTSSKVIIILSEKYREKANSFSGGVGTEYRYILEDIYKTPNKYILCTFSSLNGLDPNSILPDGLLGRDIVSIQDDSQNSFQKLFSKLMDYKPISLSQVNSKKPILEEHKIVPFKSFLENNDSNSTKKKFLKQ